MMRAVIFSIMLFCSGSAFAQMGGQVSPTNNPAVGIVPIVSAVSESTHIIKAAPGNLFSIYATNFSATAGFLLVLNVASVPIDGAVLPLDCVPIAGNSTSGINYAPGSPKVFTVGIVAVLSSGANCFTKTTSGGVTGFISGSAP